VVLFSYILVQSYYKLAFSICPSSQLMPSRILDCGPAVTLSAK